MAGIDRSLGRKRPNQHANRLQQCRPIPAREVDAPDRSLEQDVAGEDRLLVRDRERDVTWAVAGREDDIDLVIRELELLAPLQRVLRVVRLEGAEAGPREEAV